MAGPPWPEPAAGCQGCARPFSLEVASNAQLFPALPAGATPVPPGVIVPLMRERCPRATVASPAWPSVTISVPSRPGASSCQAPRCLLLWWLQ